MNECMITLLTLLKFTCWWPRASLSTSTIRLVRAVEQALGFLEQLLQLLYLKRKDEEKHLFFFLFTTLSAVWAPLLCISSSASFKWACVVRRTMSNYRNTTHDHLTQDSGCNSVVVFSTLASFLLPLAPLVSAHVDWMKSNIPSYKVDGQLHVLALLTCTEPQ